MICEAIKGIKAMSYIESRVVLMMASFCFTLLLYAEFFEI